MYKLQISAQINFSLMSGLASWYTEDLDKDSASQTQKNGEIIEAVKEVVVIVLMIQMLER